MNYESVIGLEVHAQLATTTKIFCGCSAEFGADPNTHVCPVCLGLPGALPVLNQNVVELAMRVALSAGCTIQPRSRFLRKNYFYPDLPKGYQISQFQSNEEMPLATGGGVDVPTADGGRKTIRLTRIHMEEDAGKSIHQEAFVAAGESLVDVNRCGVPLIEIVSEPDLSTSEEVFYYLTSLHQLLVYTGVSEGDMEKGHMRIDANVSIRPVGETQLGTKVEIKNVNSFRNCQRAIESEIQRQIDLVETGGEIEQATMLYDPDRNILRAMRTKEESDDYRYFPDPDLVPLVVDDAWVARVQSQIPELPEDKRARFAEVYDISGDQIDVLTADRDVADYFEAAVATGVQSRLVANWIQGDVMRVLNDRKIAIGDLCVSAEYLAELIGLIDKGDISTNIARTVFDDMVETGDSPAAIVEKKGLVQISDAGELDGVIDQIIADNPEEVERFKGGDQKLMGFFMGQLMRATKGQANPQKASQLLREKLS
ncbi:MAG: Asp-tRNA(Asn)/Glu-tRNA(Gln) amidotransferase subunit GatB [Gemmatimonadota bacterium]|nr:Asp-tRNA(Asn)/Glu-tRNA(Gln) amidotransferase subunit GatB [Gemmatimonadota bacterium]